jgi:hypothetical protein
VSFSKAGTYLKCVRHNAYVERGDFKRFIHTSASSKKKICDSTEFLMVEIKNVDRDGALKFADSNKLEGAAT